MGFTQHDQVIQAFSADGTDHSLGVRILPRGSWCDQDFFDPEFLDAVSEIIAVDAVTITDEKTWGFRVREGVDDLLGGPFRSRVRGDVEVSQPPPVMTKYDEHVQHAKRGGRHREEITSGNIWYVILKKRPPGLRRWLASADHVLGHGLLSDIVA